MSTRKGQQDRQGLYSTGQFAQAVQLTRKALRIYEEQGLLEPIEVDPWSGYRTYSANQFGRARLIRLLREMEMPLSEIAVLLETSDREEALKVVDKTLHREQDRLARIQRSYRKVTAYLGEEQLPMTIAIHSHSFSSQNVVRIRRAVTIPEFHRLIPVVLQQLTEHLEAVRAEAAGDPFCLFYGPVNREDDGPVEICLPFNGDAARAGGIDVLEIPAHVGAVGKADFEHSRYPEILEVWDDVVSWVHSSPGLKPDESVPCYEIWHQGGAVSVVQPYQTS
jgi:DNA-binding transcriptional MerR regulator